MSRDIFYQPRVLRAPSNLALKALGMGDELGGPRSCPPRLPVGAVPVGTVFLCVVTSPSPLLVGGFCAPVPALCPPPRLPAPAPSPSGGPSPGHLLPLSPAVPGSGVAGDRGSNSLGHRPGRRWMGLAREQRGNNSTSPGWGVRGGAGSWHGDFLPASACPQVSPAEKNTSETLCSLKFAERVRSVELGPVSRKAELGSWLNQEQLEVTRGLPLPLSPPIPERGAPHVLPHACSPGLVAVGWLGTITGQDVGCPQALCCSSPVVPPHGLTLRPCPISPRVTRRGPQHPPAGATRPPAPGSPPAVPPPSAGSSRPQVGGRVPPPRSAPQGSSRGPLL